MSNSKQHIFTASLKIDKNATGTNYSSVQLLINRNCDSVTLAQPHTSHMVECGISGCTFTCQLTGALRKLPWFISPLYFNKLTWAEKLFWLLKWQLPFDCTAQHRNLWITHESECIRRTAGDALKSRDLSFTQVLDKYEGNSLSC